MNVYLKELTSKLVNLSRPMGSFDVGHYLGTSHKILNVSTSDKRQIAKDFYKAHKEMILSTYLTLLDSLYRGTSFEEITIASELLGLYKAHLPNIPLGHFDKWIAELEGWAEVDTMCSGPVSFDVILNNWDMWNTVIKKWGKSPNVSKRRASLVFLVKPVIKSNDPKLRKLAYSQIEQLKHEKHVMITKAISWLLRALSKNNPSEVKSYINDNLSSLPKIATRETLRKIETGKKQ